MNIKSIRSLIAFTVLATTIGCNGLGAGDDISGEWEGEIDGEEATLELSFELEREEDNVYSGEGESDWWCLIESSTGTYWDPCIVEFEIVAETESTAGEQEIEFELDDCSVNWNGQTQSVQCPDDFELDWDGEDEMEGDLDDGTEMVLERD